MRKTIYLANPYGFSLQQRSLLLPPIISALESLGLEVWEPFSRNNQVDLSKPGWAYEIARRDVADVRNADGFFGVVNGCPPDEGVMVELGIAIALHKPIFLFRDDFRRSTDSDEYPLNLMVFAGLPEELWRDCWYESISDITRPSKGLHSWANHKSSASWFLIRHRELRDRLSSELRDRLSDIQDSDNQYHKG